MQTLDLLDWLDNTNPRWREEEFIRVENDLLEELLYGFLRDNEDWLSDVVPPCIPDADGLEWICGLFVSNGSSVEKAIWAIFGYCQKAIVDDLLDKESLELAYG